MVANLEEVVPIAEDEALLRGVVDRIEPALLEDDAKAVVTADGVDELNLDDEPGLEEEDNNGA